MVKRRKNSDESGGSDNEPKPGHPANEPEPRPEDFKPAEGEPTETNLSPDTLAIVQALQAVRNDLVVVNNNILQSVKENEKVLSKGLSEFVEGVAREQKKMIDARTQGQTATPSGQPSEPGKVIEMGKTPDGYFTPGGNQVQPAAGGAGNMALILANLPAIVEAISKIQNQNNNFFAQMGARAFMDMQTNNMLIQRANLRALASKGMLSQEEVQRAEALQNTMYESVLGQMTGQTGIAGPNGKSPGLQHPT